MNRILETSTSVGTGNFTLLGAYNNANEGIVGMRAFYERVPLNLYVPYVIEDGLGNVEKGKGYLLNNTTLVRGYVLDGTLGRDKVDFPAGTKRVYFPVENRAFGADYFNATVWKNTIANIGYRGAMTMTANRLYFTPHLQMTSQFITSVGIKVTTAVAGARIKLALYNFTRQPDTADYNSTFPIAFEIGEVSGATTGEKIITTNFYLPEGAYMIGVISTHAVSVTGNSTQYNWNHIYWETLAGDQICYLAQDSVNIDALPANTFNALTRISNQSTPCIGTRGYCL